VSLHINGEVEMSLDNCWACHGSEENPAPPTDTEGNSDVSAIGVGAHQAHVAGLDRHAEVACSSCHIEPDELLSEGHIDTDLPAEVIFAGTAVADDAVPSFDRDAVTCDNAYCHGATLDAGGQHTSPLWTTVDGTQATCGSCHGDPPPAPHPQSDQCAACHSDVVDADGFVAPELHIDGILQVEEPACNACHGSPGDELEPANQAPPLDLDGESDTSFMSVGAHQTHMDPQTADDAQYAVIACSECHVVPTEVGAEGHMDAALPAEIAWGDLASEDGASPELDRESGTCSNTYCHGATLSAGGSNIAPVWTTVDGTEATCETCHGNPPPEPHPQVSLCSSCHGSVMDISGLFVCPERHVNGEVDLGGEECP